ncbi:MAG: hypothetical protein AOA65_0774 [Candidatus Bathyarchaeota archaeon BA1]|nr:MAG: hypothetical protein AOA65_0774 [Candidatus Bathyarchaeota archaeon BA1]
MSTYLYDIYRFQTLMIGGFALSGYGVPFFVNSAIGLSTTAILPIFAEEPRRRGKVKIVLSEAENPI